MLTCLHVHMQAREHVKAPVPRLRTTKGRQRRLCWCCDRILADPITTRIVCCTAEAVQLSIFSFPGVYSSRDRSFRQVLPHQLCRKLFACGRKLLFSRKIFLSRCPDGLLCTPFIALWISMPGKAKNEQGAGQPLSHLKGTPSVRVGVSRIL